MLRPSNPFAVQHDNSWVVFGELVDVDRQFLPELARILVRPTYPSCDYDPALCFVIEVPTEHLQRSPRVIADLERLRGFTAGFYIKELRGARLELRHTELGVNKQ
ncbi:hypothetical protein ACK3Z8_11845 [Aeromonas caviae]